MKIAFIDQEKISFLSNRKTGEYSENLAKELAKKGHQVFFYMTKDCVSKLDGVNEITINSGHLGKKIQKKLFFLQANWQALFQDYDVIHYYCDSLPFSFLLLKVFKRRTVFLLTFKFQSGERNKNSWLKSISFRWVDQAITTQKSFKKYVLEKYAKKIFLMPWGIDGKKEENINYLKKWNLQKGSYILWTNKLEKESGAHLVIKAFKNLEDMHLTREKKLVIFETKILKNTYAKEIKDMARGRENIIFVGCQSEEILNQFFLGAYFFLKTNLKEKIPSIVLKAMKYGKATLTIDSKNRRDFFNDEVALFFKKNIRGDLEEKMVRMINNPDETKKMGERAIVKVKSKNSWENIANQLESLCKDIFFRKQKKIFSNKMNERNI